MVNSYGTSDNQEDAMKAFIETLKKDPLYDEKIEFGRMLMRHIDSFSEEELKRYNELKEKLHKEAEQEELSNPNKDYWNNKRNKPS